MNYSTNPHLAAMEAKLEEQRAKFRTNANTTLFSIVFGCGFGMVFLFFLDLFAKLEGF